MNETTSDHFNCGKPAFGIASIGCFCLASGLCLLVALHLKDMMVEIFAGRLYGLPGGTSGPQTGARLASIWDIACLVAYFGALIMWLLGSVFGIGGLVRAERPRWPAVIGLLLCIIPWAWILFAGNSH